jgi:hypothetical protein
MKKKLREKMFFLTAITFITIIVAIVINWNSITKFIIGKKMNEYSQTTISWEQIDFTKVIKDETRLMSWTDNNQSDPALAKYRIEGIFGVQDVVLVYGSNRTEVGFNALRNGEEDPYYDDKNEQAYVFRTEDNGKTFEKISLGHGSAGYGKELHPIYANNIIYIGVEESDTHKVRYYTSKDLGKTWKLNDWMPTTVWKDETLFIEKSDPYTEEVDVKMSKNGGKTWKPLEGALQSFYDKTHSLWQLDKKTLVGMTRKKEVLLFNIEKKEESVYPLRVPDGKDIGRIGTNTINNKNEFYLVLYDAEKRAKHEYSQQSIWFPITNEHIQMTKKLPQNIHFTVSEDYIGGFFKYGDDLSGIPVQVYTLDRGRHWNYTILEKYRMITQKAYIKQQFWFVANTFPKLESFLMRGEMK